MRAMSPPGFSVLPDWARHWWFGTDVTWRNGGGLLGFGIATVVLGYMEVVYYVRHGGHWGGCVGAVRGLCVSVGI